MQLIKQTMLLSTLLLGALSMTAQSAQAQSTNYAFARKAMSEMIVRSEGNITTVELSLTQLENIMAELEAEAAALEDEVRRLTPRTCPDDQKIWWGGAYGCANDRTQDNNTGTGTPQCDNGGNGTAKIVNGSTYTVTCTSKANRTQTLTGTANQGVIVGRAPSNEGTWVIYASGLYLNCFDQRDPINPMDYEDMNGCKSYAGLPGYGNFLVSCTWDRPANGGGGGGGC